MNQEIMAYGYALASVLTFSTAAIGFTYFSKKVSPLWMNFFKCSVSLMFCIPFVFYFHGKLYWNFFDVWPFYLSGFIGLSVGDWFLLSAYKKIGPARTLILLGFQPFIAGGFSYFMWNEKIHPVQLIAVFFFIACLFLFSYERFKKDRSWEFKGLLLALSGVTLDSVGLILTRYGFMENENLSGLEVQYLRTLSAFFGFFLFFPFVKIHFIDNIKKLSVKEKAVAFVSSFFGTFLSLVFYMQAIKIGKLATVTSIVLTDPMMSTFFESLWLKTWPSKYLWTALACFLCAMFFLFYPQIVGTGR